MRRSLVLSAVLHLILLVVVVINFSSGGKPPAVDHPVAVDVVAPSAEVSQLKAGNPDKPDKDTQAPPAPQPAPEAKPESAAPTALVPAPEAKPAEKSAKKVAAPPPPKPKTETAEPVPPPLPKPKPEPRAEQRKPLAAKPAPAPAPIPAPQAQQQPQKPSEPRPDRQAEAPGETGEKVEPRLPSEPERTARHDPPPPDRRTDARDDVPEPDREYANEQDWEAETEPDPDHEYMRRRVQPPETMDAAKSRFDPHRISALINRDPAAGAPPPSREGPPKPWRQPGSLQDQITGMTPGAAQHERYGSPEGQGDNMSANEIDAFRAQISRCWAPPVGGLGGEAIIVKLHIELNEDGTLARPPQVANRINSPFFTPAADSAVRAVLQCEPYRMPPEKFSQWRDMLLNFDPRQMYGG